MLPKCCCCIDLRAGCITIAILGIVGSSAWFSYSNNGQSEAPIDKASYSITVSASVMGILSSLCLLFGAFKNHKDAVMAYLVLEVIQFLLRLVFSILLFVQYHEKKSGTNVALELWNYQNIGVLIGGIFALIIPIVWIYLWFCVFSFYQKIKRGTIEDVNGKGF